MKDIEILVRKPLLTIDYGELLMWAMRPRQQTEPLSLLLGEVPEENVIMLVDDYHGIRLIVDSRYLRKVERDSEGVWRYQLINGKPLQPAAVARQFKFVVPLRDGVFLQKNAIKVVEAAQFVCSPEGHKPKSGAMGNLKEAVAEYNKSKSDQGWSPWAVFDRGHCDKLLFHQNAAGETQDVLVRHTPWTSGPETEEDFDKLVEIAESVAITNERVETEWPW